MGVVSNDTLGGTQQAGIINESGLYALVLRSRNSRDAVAKHCREHGVAKREVIDDEKGMQIVHAPSGDLEKIVINESGMYHAVLKSRKQKPSPSASG